MPPSKYRAAILLTNIRISRYHPEMNTHCDSGCGAFKFLDYIFQVSPGMESRRERHNELVCQLEKKLTKKSYITKIEPCINVDGNFRNPDLVAQERDQSIVCDINIISDTAPSNEEHINKAQKYDIKNSYLDDKQLSKWVSLSTGSYGCICLQLKRSDFFKIILAQPCFPRSMVMNFSTTALSGTYHIRL